MKVAVGSQRRIEQLGERIQKAAADYARTHKWRQSKAQQAFQTHMSKIIRLALHTLQENVTVNGNDWDPTLKDDDVEPRDRQLLAELRALQLETYEAIDRVAHLRRTGPSQAASMVRASLAKQNDALHSEAAAVAAQVTRADEAAADAGQQGMSEDMAQRLQTVLETIAVLTDNLPEIHTSVQDLRKTLEYAEEPEEKGQAEATAAAQASAAAAAPSGAASSH